MLYFSLILCALCFGISMKYGLSAKLRPWITVLLVATGFFDAFYLVSNSITGIGITEGTLYHLRTGLNGAGHLDYLNSYALATFMILLCGLLLIGTLKARNSDVLKTSWLCIFISFLALFVSPGTRQFFNIVASRAFASSQDYGIFSKHYRPAQIFKIESSTKNLIYLYLESFERSYLDENIFPNLAPNLLELEKKSLHFTDIQQVAATGWTIAGMVSSQCGLPLFAPFAGNFAPTDEAFLPNANCLGDLLASQGYELSFYGGADIKFAGKGKFYRSHGFLSVLGLPQLKEQIEDPQYQHTWGLYDDSLFEIISQKLEKLANSKKKFGLFALSLDTHHPAGYLSKSCENIKYGDGLNPILNAIKCSDQLVGKFVRGIQSSSVGKNSVIVIASDHLAMKNSATNLLNKASRRNLFMVLSPSVKPKLVSNPGSTLDISPSIAKSLGFKIEMGLGRNLLEEESLTSQFKNFDLVLSHWTSEILDFWKPKDKKLGEQVWTSIAHAGGAYKGHTYTNSLQALTHNYDLGFRNFEIDLSFTRDREPVCLHDWEASYKSTFNRSESIRPSLNEFNKLIRENPSFSNCDLKTLMAWLKQHRNAYLVTDAKESNQEVLQIIASRYPKLMDRVLPQIYLPDEYPATRALGFKHIIWTLYRYSGSDDQVFSTLQSWLQDGASSDSIALTMPTTRLKNDLSERVHTLGIKTYVHTINSYSEKRRLQTEKLISDVYTDYLQPN